MWEKFWSHFCVMPKRMKWNQFQLMILKNSEHFSNQRILNFFLAILLDSISWIVSNYLKLNLPQNLIFSKKTFNFDFVSGIWAHTMWESPFLFLFFKWSSDIFQCFIYYIIQIIIIQLLLVQQVWCSYCNLFVIQWSKVRFMLSSNIYLISNVNVTHWFWKEGHCKRTCLVSKKD